MSSRPANSVNRRMLLSLLGAALVLAAAALWFMTGGRLGGGAVPSTRQTYTREAFRQLVLGLFNSQDSGNEVSE